jgi:nuclear protein localization family protein 4
MSSTRYKREPLVKKDEKEAPKEIKPEPPKEIKKEVPTTVPSTEKKIVLRLRGKDGNFKYELSPSEPLDHVRKLLEKDTGVAPSKYIFSKNMDSSIKKDLFMSTKDSISKNGIAHGDLIFFSYDKNISSKQDEEDNKLRKEKESILLKMQNGEELSLKELQLTDGKKQWTPQEYEKYRDQFKLVVDPLPWSICTKVTVDEMSMVQFSNTLTQFGFSFQRCGFLLGVAKDAKKPEFKKKEEKDPDEPEDAKTAKYEEVQAYAIYEPPQEGDERIVIELEDDDAVKLNTICGHLGLKRLGYIFSHVRFDDKRLTNVELMKAAEMQIKYGPHFVTLVALPANRENTAVAYEAFQASPVCCELVKKGALEIDTKNPYSFKCKKPVVFKGTKKENTDIDVTFLFKAVAIASDREGFFRSGFPPKNRPSFVEQQADYDMLKTVLVNRKRSGLPFLKRISDFHLLFFVAENILDKSETKQICDAIKTQNKNSASGFEYILNSAVGID